MAFYGIDTQGELRPYLGYEWLLTNGAGAYASSSVVGCNTRRYHALLCAATLPPLGRIVALNRVGELVYLDGRSDFLELSISQFGSVFHPRGDRYLRRFELATTARWQFHLEDVTISRELVLVRGRNVAGLRYRVDLPEGRTADLHLLPFVTLRDYHALRRHDPALFDVRCGSDDLRVTDGHRVLEFCSDGGRFEHRGDWWHGQTYALETERGLDDTEDLFVPGALVQRFASSGTLTVWAGLDESGLHELDWNRAVEAATPPPPRIVVPGARVEGPISVAVGRLLRAANDFVVSRRRGDGGEGTTIIAGYPWFGDWGRDTMISLPGLLLVSGRFREAAAVLDLYAAHVSEGMVPNRFDDYTNEPSYNTVDASLWFIHAAFEYLRYSEDRTPLRDKLIDACRQVVEGYRRGTRYNIRMDEADGLIAAGGPDTQLTWMDAKHDGVVFTPRHGKAVEINALWYNALMLLGEEQLAGRVRQSFVRTFWQNPFRGLCDTVNENGPDRRIRPNQIFAVSLPHSPLAEDQQAAVVEVVRRELLTPFGLRTLARSEPGYRPRCAGPPAQRDAAYHNGTVWPWLIGPFLDAYLRVHHHSPDAQRQARVWLGPLLNHMNQGCIGQISECFDGDEPHRPAGCPAQAWSVAEVLRLAVAVGA